MTDNHIAPQKETPIELIGGKSKADQTGQSLTEEQEQAFIGTLSRAEAQVAAKYLDANATDEDGTDITEDQDYVSPYPRTDTGNGEIIKDISGNNIRYDHGLGKYFTFNGQLWEVDHKEIITQYAIDAARKRQALSILIKNPTERKIEYGFGVHSENGGKLNSALKLFRTFSGIAVGSDDWNTNNFLIQFNNGVVNLKTGEFRPGTPEDMIRQTVNFDYEADAECPLWVQTISEIMDNNSDMIKYMQDIIGYSLTGETSEQCFFILTGDGSNGKSILLNMLLALLGDYSIHTPFSTFEAWKYRFYSNDLARMTDARLVTSSESSQSGVLNEERVKSMTGGDPITARFLRKEYNTFTPKFKIMLAVNTLPEIQGNDNGIWRRIKVIPFNVSFRGREDFTLGKKLEQELPGIMNWAIKGALAWQQHGLIEPQIVTDAVNAYRSESGPITGFLYNMTVADNSAKVQASDLYNAYCAYCVHADTIPGSQTLFGRQMRTMGYSSRKSNGTNWYFGFSLTDFDLSRDVYKEELIVDDPEELADPF